MKSLPVLAAQGEGRATASVARLVPGPAYDAASAASSLSPKTCTRR